MHRRFYKASTSLALALLCGACAQTTRHSNTLIFGTNTTFGIKAGTDAQSVPTVVVGYDRQEAVLMPLVANTEDNGRTQSPCKLDAPLDASGDNRFAVHPCSLVAVRGEAMDSYSVLASFGAKFDGSAGPNTGAKGGLAQYFATGMAAQLLALSGGASVVAVGESATAAAANPPDPASVAALYSNDSAYATGVVKGESYLKFEKDLLARIQLTPAAQLQTKILALETAIGSPTSIAKRCAEIESCQKAVKLKIYFLPFTLDAMKATGALLNW